MPNQTKPNMPDNAGRRTTSSTAEVQAKGTVRQPRSTPRPPEPVTPFPHNESARTSRTPEPIKPFPRNEPMEQNAPRLMARPYTGGPTQRINTAAERDKRVAVPPYPRPRQDDRVLRQFVDDSPVALLRTCAQKVALVIHPAFTATVFVVNLLLQVVWGIVHIGAPFLSSDSQRRIRRMSGPMLHEDSPAAMIVFAALLLFGLGFVTKPFLLAETADPRGFHTQNLSLLERITSPDRAIISFWGLVDSVGDIAAKVQPVAPVDAPAQPLGQRAPGDHNLQGAPSISPQQIDRILESFGSPATGSGQVWYDLGLKYNIDPAYAVAFFIHESSAGTNPAWAGWKDYGSRVSTHNVGNIICAGYPTCYGRFRDYSSWEAGIDDWYRLISVEYIQGRGTLTVEQIIPIYAPSFENNVGAYVGAVEEMVDSWRTQGVP